MFKKRSRPTGVREKPKDVEEVEKPGESSGSGQEEEAAGEAGQSVEDLILLRKLRKMQQQQGIDIEKLNRGEAKKKARPAEGAAEKYGLQTVQRDDKGDDGLEEGDEERAKRLVRSNNFTQQTNALDVDKHMLAYIEEELSKRRGNTVGEGEEITKTETYDPQAELYALAEKYKAQERRVKEDEEGNVTNSLGMLTSIPEVDLGMDNRLRNIEMTEKAKREMMEQRKAEQAERAGKPGREEDYSAARFHRPNQRIASDIYAIHDARREAAGGAIPAQAPPPRTSNADRHEAATDEQVYDRFKKRMKR